MLPAEYSTLLLTVPAAHQSTAAKPVSEVAHLLSRMVARCSCLPGAPGLPSRALLHGQVHLIVNDPLRAARGCRTPMAGLRRWRLFAAGLVFTLQLASAALLVRTVLFRQNPV
jgi:hypothetical protein